MTNRNFLAPGVVHAASAGKSAILPVLPPPAAPAL
jgi:hypothetical protein